MFNNCYVYIFCLYIFRPASSVLIRVGSSYSDHDGQLIPLKEIILHPLYTEKYTDDHDLYPVNDIAILLLKEPLDFNKSVSPIQIAEASETITDGLLANVSGWGAKTPMQSNSGKLRFVEVPTVNHQKCIEMYPKYEIDDTMLCAGYDEGKKDSCTGDSGGPLAINGTLYGIVSFGEGCARPVQPGVYASVPYFRKFIDETVSGNMYKKF